VPKTATDLKDAAYLVHPTCTKPAFDYLVDKVLEVSTSEGTYEAFKTALTTNQ